MVSNDDGILVRNDKRGIHNFAKTPNKEIKTDDLTAVETKQVEDGLKTNIRCRWCNGLVKEVYIPELKNGKDGKPFDVVFDYEPCAACREKWKSLVVFIEVTDEEPYTDCLPIDSDLRELDPYIDPDDDPDGYAEKVEKEVYDNHGESLQIIQYGRVYFYPTGRHIGITPEDVKKYFRGNKKEINAGAIIYLEEDMFQETFGDCFK